MILQHQSDGLAQKAEDFGEVGAVIVEVSAYELSLDKFIFRIAKRMPKLAKSISGRFPMRWQNKVEFLIATLSAVPQFRTMPIFDDGFWTEDYIWYSSAQMFDVRNHLAHGDVTCIEINKAHRIWTAEKMRVRPSTDGKGQMVGLIRYRYSTALLEAIYHDATVMGRYLRRLCAQFDRHETWEKWYQGEKEMADNRRALGELDFVPFSQLA